MALVLYYKIWGPNCRTYPAVSMPKLNFVWGRKRKSLSSWSLRLSSFPRAFFIARSTSRRVITPWYSRRYISAPDFTKWWTAKSIGSKVQAGPRRAGLLMMIFVCIMGTNCVSIREIDKWEVEGLHQDTGGQVRDAPIHPPKSLSKLQTEFKFPLPKNLILVHFFH